MDALLGSIAGWFHFLNKIKVKKMNVSEIKKELWHGNGWAVIEGCDIVNPEESILDSMAGFGLILNQNNNGDLISFVHDKGLTADDVLNKGVVSGDNKGQTTNRPYLTNAELEFHTDLCDLAFLLCVTPASRGGESKIVNSKAVYNYMSQHFPSDVVILSDTFKIMHQTPLKPDGKNYLIDIPIFTEHKGNFSSFLLRTFIFVTYQRLGLPLSDKHVAALNRVNEVSEKLCTTFKLKAGDLFIMNNHQAYHARNSFDDPKRLLLRGWVSDAESFELAPAFRDLYGDGVGAGARRGGFVKL